MDTNFEIMNAMNYRFDNPENGDKVKIFEPLAYVAGKSVISFENLKRTDQFFDLCPEPKAIEISKENVKNQANIEYGMDKVRAM